MDDELDNQERYSSPMYVVKRHRQGGLRIEKHPQPWAEQDHLYALDEALALLSDQLENGLAVDIGRP